MLESNIIRIALIIYSIFALLAALLLWKNSVAPDALKNTGIIIASILPGLIAVLPYLNSEEVSEEFHYILFYDSATKEIVTGDEYNAYTSSYMNMFCNLSRVPDASKAENFGDLMGNKGLDIIEKGILETFILYFMKHWDIILSESIGPTFTSVRIEKKSEAKSSLITLEEIRKLFFRNKLISTEGVLVHSGFSLPPDSTINLSQKENSRSIEFKNKYTTVSIEIFASSGGVAQQGIWGVLKPDPKNMDRFYSIEFLVKLTMKVSRFNRHSPTTIDYKRWFSNICKILSNYDWQNINKEIERYEMRKAVSKSLEKSEEKILHP